MLEFWLAESDEDKVVSAILQVEVRSAICRLRKEKRMTHDEASFALASLVAEISGLTQQMINPQVLEAANEVIDRHSLRALDALQLGSAIVARDLLKSPEMQFIASDHALLAAAEAEGLIVWNPATSNNPGKP